MLFFFDIGYAVSEVERAVESFRLDSRTFERRVEITSCRSCGSLTIGEDPARLRVRIHEKYTALTRNSRSEAFTGRNEVFVTTTTETVSV